MRLEINNLHNSATHVPKHDHTWMRIIYYFCFHLERFNKCVYFQKRLEEIKLLEEKIQASSNSMSAEDKKFRDKLQVTFLNFRNQVLYTDTCLINKTQANLYLDEVHELFFFLCTVFSESFVFSQEKFHFNYQYFTICLKYFWGLVVCFNFVKLFWRGNVTCWFMYVQGKTEKLLYTWCPKI